MSYFNFSFNPSEIHRNEASDSDDGMIIVEPNANQPPIQVGTIDEASASDDGIVVVGSNHVSSTHAATDPPSGLSAPSTHDDALALLLAYPEGTQPNSPHSLGLLAGRNEDHLKELQRANLDDIKTVVSEELNHLIHANFAGRADQNVEFVRQLIQDINSLNHQIPDANTEASKSNSQFVPTAIQHEHQASLHDDVSEVSCGYSDNESVLRLIDEMFPDSSAQATSSPSLQRRLVVETSHNVNPPTSQSASTNPPTILRQDVMNSSCPEFSFETFALIGCRGFQNQAANVNAPTSSSATTNPPTILRQEVMHLSCPEFSSEPPPSVQHRGLQNQTPRETMPSEDKLDSRACRNFFASAFTGFKEVAVLVCDFSASVYILLRFILCLSLSFVGTIWEGTRRFYSHANRFSRRCLAGYSNMVVGFMAGALTMLALVMVLWLILYGTVSVVNFTSANVTAMIDPFLQPGRYIQQALGGEILPDVPPVRMRSAQEEQIWSDAFLGMKPEPSVAETLSPPIPMPIGMLHSNGDDAKQYANESLVISQTDPSDSFETLQALAGMFIILLFSTLFLMLKPRQDETPEDAAANNTQLQLLPVAPMEVSTMKLRNEDNTGILTPPKVQNQRTQENFENMTTDELRDECKSRGLTPPSIKADRVRVLCIHDYIPHDFPEIDLSEYKGLKTNDLKRYLGQHKKPKSGKMDHLMYRLACARLEIYMDMSCKEMRDILRQENMVQTGTKGELALRLAEAGPSLPLVA